MAALLPEATLEATATVANNRMNRERQLRGTNGYDHELGFDVTKVLAPGTRWLDVCCGTARALHEAERELGPEVTIVGVDLVDHFWPRPPASRVRLVVSPLRAFTVAAPFDLITCVHGLHYVGDKLGLLTRMCGWLRPGGRLVAHLDLDHVVVNGRASTARILRQAGFGWNARRHLVEASGAAHDFPLVFVGAREAGPNYTGQPAVESHYGSIHANGG